MSHHITIPQAQALLARQTELPFAVVMQHETMSVEYFVPKGRDTQQPHTQDELYIIISGTSQFFRSGEMLNVSPGDLLFVPAGMEHRFEQFSADFATWVIFYGEKKNSEE